VAVVKGFREKSGEIRQVLRMRSNFIMKITHFLLVLGRIDKMGCHVGFKLTCQFGPDMFS
jgi:hypothetical protein